MALLKKERGLVFIEAQGGESIIIFRDTDQR